MEDTSLVVVHTSVTNSSGAPHTPTRNGNQPPSSAVPSPMTTIHVRPSPAQTARALQDSQTEEISPADDEHHGQITSELEEPRFHEQSPDIFPALAASTSATSASSVTLDPLSAVAVSKPFHTIVHRPSISYSGINSRLRRLDLSHFQTFNSLPNDLLSLTLEFLSSKDLCASARTSKRFAILGSKNKLWMVRCGFMAHNDVSNNLSISWMLQSERNLKRRFLKYRSWKVASHENTYREQVKLLHQRKLMCCLHNMDGPCFFVVLGVFLTLGFGLTMRELDNAATFDHSLDFVAMWPFLSLIGFLLLLCVCICVARYDRQRQVCCHPQAYIDENSDGIVRGFIHHVLHDNSRQLGWMGTMFMALCLWGVFYVLKVTDTVSWSWPVIFLPILFVFFLLCLLPCQPIFRTQMSSFRIRVENCTVSWIFVIGPVAAFIVLLCVRLQLGLVLTGGSHQNLSWMYVCIPLFILKFFFCLLSILMSLDERSATPCIAILCCYGPLLCFEVLIANWLDNGAFDTPVMRFTSLFIPLWIFMAYCLLVSLLFCVLHRPTTARWNVLWEPKPERQAIWI